MKNFEKRLQKLENSAPVIDNLAAYVMWVAHGCQEGVRWDKKFKTAITRFGQQGKRYDFMKAATVANQYCTYRRFLFGACNRR